MWEARKHTHSHMILRLPSDQDSSIIQVQDHFFHGMGILSIHNHAFLIKECVIPQFRDN
jgi:hypothetical protein